jgi:hypothetical protein
MMAYPKVRILEHNVIDLLEFHRHGIHSGSTVTFANALLYQLVFSQRCLD